MLATFTISPYNYPCMPGYFWIYKTKNQFLHPNHINQLSRGQTLTNMHCKTTVGRPTILFIFVFIYSFTLSLIDYTNPHCVKCPYSELFWSAFSRIRIEYGEIRSIAPHSVQMWESAGQNNSEYKHYAVPVSNIHCFSIIYIWTATVLLNINNYEFSLFSQKTYYLKQNR